jgi:Na+/proline symporter
MVKEMIKRNPLIIGLVTVIAFYVVTNVLSNLNATITTFLAIGILVGFMVGENYKTGAINGALFGVIGALIVAIILVITYTLYGYGAYLGLVAPGLLLSFVFNVIVAIVGGVIGAQVRIEIDSNDAAPEDKS